MKNHCFFNVFAMSTNPSLNALGLLLGSLLDRLGHLLGRCWALLGRPWALLGALGALLGHSLAALGVPLGAPWALWGRSWRPVGRLWALGGGLPPLFPPPELPKCNRLGVLLQILGCSFTSWGALGTLGAFWAVFGLLLRHSGAFFFSVGASFE